MIWLIIYLVLIVPHYFLGKIMITSTENNALGLLLKDEEMKKGLQITCAICYPLIYVSLICALIIIAVMIPIKNCLYLKKKK